MKRAALAALLVLQLWVGASTAYLLALLGLAARRPPLVPGPSPAGKRLRTVVLIAAHNEEDSLPATLAALARQDFPVERREYIVLADNCTDATAEIAGAAGVTVWERSDENRGKGQALAWAFERVARERPEAEAVALVDGDCLASPTLLSALDDALRRGARAAQAIYDVANPESSPTSALRWAAFALKHRVRPRGRVALGLSAGFFGNGTAFRAELLRAHPWQSFSVAEDIGYHLELAQAGVRVAYVESARIESLMPTTPATAYGQQLRWESGNADLARRYGVQLALAGARRRDANLALAGVELLLPPQSLLAPLNALCLSAAAVTRSRPLALAATATSAGHALFVLGGLRVAGAPPEVYRALLSAPGLVAAKLGIFARIARGDGTTEYLRTEREPVTMQPVEVG